MAMPFVGRAKIKFSLRGSFLRFWTLCASPFGFIGLFEKRLISLLTEVKSAI